MLGNMPALNAGVAARHAVTLQMRIGVATGLVVVGDIVGAGAAAEAAVVGETPNLAARLQGIAGPDQIAVAGVTRDLLGELFEYDDLGVHALKGIANPVQVWRVMRESESVTRYEARRPGARSPLVGRQEELGLLVRSWEASKESHGQVVLVQGEAGIGKSRLIEALRDYVSADEYVWVSARCSPYHTNSTLYPVIEHLKRAIGWTPEDGPAARLEKLEAALAGQSMPLAEAVPLFAELMSVPLPEGRYPKLALSPMQQREQTLDALAGWLLEVADRQPVLQVWEDLHWADPTTLELIGLYIEQSPTVSMLNVLTYRPEFVPPWSMHSHMTPIALNRLERGEVEAIVANMAKGKAMPSEVLTHIAEKSDGVPLFVEELAKTILESGVLTEHEDRYVLNGSLTDMRIPSTLQDSLMARLDRVPTLREVAQIGAVLGREFAYEMLSAVIGLEESQLTRGLGQLVEDELLYQRGRPPRARYIFKHALIQDAAYQSLLKRTREQHHRNVASLLERRFPETAEAHPELIAHHYTEAGDYQHAVEYWLRAGEHARERSAYLEAIAHFTKGIQTLHGIDDERERAHLELRLQAALGHACIVAKGHGSPAAQAAYARARVLCEELGDVPERIPTLFGLWRFHVSARPLPESLDIATQLRRIAEEKRDVELHVIACYALGYTALCMGSLPDAKVNLENGIERYSPDQRRVDFYRTAQDPGVACRGYLAMAEWLLGYPDRARARMEESISLAEALDDRFSLAYALCFTGAIVTDMCRTDQRAIVERGLEIATEGGFSLWVAFARVNEICLSLADGASPDAMLGRLRESVAAISALGVTINSPYFLARLARELARAGRNEQALGVLEEARMSIETRDERWWEAEILRLHGEFLPAETPDRTNEAENLFKRALDTARSQEARSLELRAATSLARLWQHHGRTSQAYQLLSGAYDWFTEGFETDDLRDARTLLGQLNPTVESRAR